MVDTLVLGTSAAMREGSSPFLGTIPTSMYLIDTHSHISHFPKRDQEAVINRARAAGVKKLINVSCDLDQIMPHTQLANAHENIWSSAGIMPSRVSGI